MEPSEGWTIEAIREARYEWERRWHEVITALFIALGEGCTVGQLRPDRQIDDIARSIAPFAQTWRTIAVKADAIPEPGFWTEQHAFALCWARDLGEVGELIVGAVASGNVQRMYGALGNFSKLIKRGDDVLRGFGWPVPASNAAAGAGDR